MGAMPVNGGVYNALLNTTKKKTAALAGCLSFLSYLATYACSACVCSCGLCVCERGGGGKGEGGGGRGGLGVCVRVCMRGSECAHVRMCFHGPK